MILDKSLVLFPTQKSGVKHVIIVLRFSQKTLCYQNKAVEGS
jgi:hypothetical protein